jgi:hypothetical protein
MRGVLCALIASGCGSSGPATPATPPKATAPSDAERRAERDEQLRKERLERQEIVDKHRQLESAQQDALGATCTDTEAWAKQHCTPSCYPMEPKDPRTGGKVAGRVAVEHRVCRREDEQVLVVDELEPTLRTRKQKGRAPRAPKKGTWQAELVTWFSDHHLPKPGKRDAFAIVGSWRPVEHPLTHERLECVTLVHYTTLAKGKLDDCGARGKTTCEAAGNAAARAINLAHFRLAEARQLDAKGNFTGCSAAALDAVATARGMPRWRQYAKLNVGQWTDGLAYRTRFDGTLDEDQLFAAVATIGTEAEQLYVECSRKSPAVTTPMQEHAFHSCP